MENKSFAFCSLSEYYLRKEWIDCYFCWEKPQVLYYHEVMFRLMKLERNGMIFDLIVWIVWNQTICDAFHSFSSLVQFWRYIWNHFCFLSFFLWHHKKIQTIEDFNFVPYHCTLFCSILSYSFPLIIIQTYPWQNWLSKLV